MSEPSENPRVVRRLAAILAADIVGYSALMGADEARTVRDLKDHLAVVLPMVSGHHGRVIDTAGDGILAEFGSVVNAVECAVAIQKSMTTRNAEVEDGRQMQFRIGINIGDVIHDEGRLYGDGVNVAARLEAGAEPGGICISGAAYEQVRRKLALDVTDLGLLSLKNIAEPVRIYRIMAEPSTTDAQAKPSLALPDKPSIAVLPFANLSSHSEQEYLADGIVDDIITELSRFSELFVIARNSSFQYKGRAIDMRQIGRELGVRYVLEGSARRGGDRIRISAQLIDTATGAHRWAERYDRALEDVFAVQDAMVRTIVAILAAHVRIAETERTLAKPPNSWQAYDYYLQGVEAFASFFSTFDLAHMEKARRLLQQSLAIDPNYSRSYATLAQTYVTAWHDPADDDFLNPAILERAHELARKAVQLDRNLPRAHHALGYVLSARLQHDASITAFEKAMSLNPNYVDWRFGIALIRAGDSKRAIEVVQTCMRLDPFYEAYTSFVLALAHYMVEQYSQALPLLRDYVDQMPKYRPGHSLLAATLARMGHLEDARAEAVKFLRLGPSFTISGVGRRLMAFRDPRDEKHLFDALRLVGLPE